MYVINSTNAFRKNSVYQLWFFSNYQLHQSSLWIKFTCKSMFPQSFLFNFYIAFDTFLRGGGNAQVCVQETSRKCCFSVIYSFQNSKFRSYTRPRRTVGNNIQKSYMTILKLALLFSSHRKRGQCVQRFHHPCYAKEFRVPRMVTLSSSKKV